MLRTNTQLGLGIPAGCILVAASSAAVWGQVGVLPGNQTGAFNSAWLTEQTRLVDVSSLLSPNLKLDGVQFGSVHLGLSIQKEGAPPPAPGLHFTVAAAQRDWLRQMTARGAHKMAFTGDIDDGAARGLSFGLAQWSGGGKFTDTSLGFARGGLETHLRIRDVSNTFKRSGIMSDNDWNAAKDLLGWKQTDMSLKWTGTPGLSVTTVMENGRKSSTGETRGKRRLDLGWSASKTSSFSLYTEQTSAGNRSRTSHGNALGFAWNQKLGREMSFALSQDSARGLDGKTSRTQKLSFGTAESARTYFSASLLSASKDGVRSSDQRFAFRSDPNAASVFSASLIQTASGKSRASERRLEWHTSDKAPTYLGASRVENRKDATRRTLDSFHLRAARFGDLHLDGDLLSASDGRKREEDHTLHLQMKPARAWNLDGIWRQKSGVSESFANVKLAGVIGKRTQVLATMLHVPDGSSPNLRQDGVHLEQSFGKDSRLTADWLSLLTKNGTAARVTTLDMRSALRFGAFTAFWRSGGGDVVPDCTSFTFTNAGHAGKGPCLEALWKRTAGSPVTQALKGTWKFARGLSLEGAYALHPEDKNGKPQDIRTQTAAINWALSSGWNLAFSYGGNRAGNIQTVRRDLSVKGKVDGASVDLGVSTLAKRGLPDTPAYHVNIERAVDDGHRFVCKLERQTRALAGRDNFTGQLELLTDF